MAQFSILLVMAAVMSALLGAFPASADAAQSSDDLSSIACNFFFRLKGGTGASPLDFSVNTLDSSTDCDSYHIYLSNHPTDRSQSTVRISETAATGFMTYHLADMPLNVVVLLLTPERSPTRVLARRETDRITFVVGRRPFQEPPPSRLLPRSSSLVARPTGPPPSRDRATREGAASIVGSWKTVGVILELRRDGTFSRVSHSARGTFGGVIGVDDGGTYEVRGNEIVFHGILRQRTCTFSLTSTDELLVCDVPYSRE